jgi:MFS family permease
VGGIITLIAVTILFVTIKEPPELLEKPEHEEGLGVLKDLRRIPKESIPSLALIIAAIFFYMLGFNSVETFFSSYCVSTLGVSEGTASLIFSAAYISFIIFAIPSGMLAGRIGRKRTMMLGLLIFSVLLVIAYFTPVVPVIVAIMAFGGLAWALININGLPMVVDISESDRMMGTFTGLYFIATTLAAVLGPILNGWVIDTTGRNYSLIFIICPVFFVFSMLVLVPVKGGEAKLA